MLEGATKPWWASKGVWGGIVAVAAGAAGLFGFNLDASFQGDLTNWVVAVAGVLGGGLSLLGRIKASKAIGAK